VRTEISVEGEDDAEFSPRRLKKRIIIIVIKQINKRCSKSGEM
jgi:hypothetical protein